MQFYDTVPVKLKIKNNLVKLSLLLQIRSMIETDEFLHCKKRLTIFLSPAGMSPTKLSLAGRE